MRPESRVFMKESLENINHGVQKAGPKSILVGAKNLKSNST